MPGRRFEPMPKGESPPARELPTRSRGNTGTHVTDATVEQSPAPLTSLGSVPPLTEAAVSRRLEGPAVRLPEFEELTAASLPAGMSQPCRRGPYRVPIIQFVCDWNTSNDREATIRDAPAYNGADNLVLPAIATVVHALADRDGVPVPPWVRSHRHPTHAVLFGDTDDGWYGRWLRQGRAPDACQYHRVWFHRRLLDKGTPDWWLPWD